MKTLTNLFLKVAVLSLAVLPMLTSCYDDTSIWDKFEEIDNRLESLEQSLNDQVQALSSIIDGKTTIASCEKNSDGSYKVTLSNGAKFTVLPDGTDYSAFVSVITVNGVKCWATYDANGKLIALTDDAGQPVPVINDYKTQVEVVVEDGVYYLVIDGKKYMTGYDTKDLVQVFSSCTQLKDASGNVYAMSFTFGDGIKVTVAVDGYNGVIFRLPNLINNEVVTEYFVCYGDTQSLLLDMAGVIDYIMQIPDGWRVAEREDEYTGEKYIDITAPAVKTIEDGAAVADGELKVVAVVEGGKAAVSKIMLSSDPFKTFEVNGSKAVIEPYAGVQKYVYGVTKKSEYNEAALFTTISGLLQSTGSLPAGYAMSETAIDAEHAETYGKTLDNNIEYVFWAIPALYREGNNGGFYVKEGTFKTYEFSNVTVKFGQTAASLFDAEINVTFTGVEKIYGGTLQKTGNVLAEIVHMVNSGAYTPIEAPASYKGLASAFPSKEANSSVEFTYGTEYISWVIPVQEGKTAYTANDIVSTTFSTRNVTSGSSLKLTVGNAVTSQTSISIPVSAEGAEMISYVFMTKSDGDRISGVDNNTKAELIFDNADCVSSKGSSVTASVDKLTPNSTMYLLAVAVDKDGKYGTVSQTSATTKALEYNSLTVTATDLEVSSDRASFKIEVSGGEAADYVYWIGKSSDDFWLNVKYLGGNQTMASQYMALYPQDEHIVKVMNKYGKIGTDGTLNVTELAKSTEYILIVAAKDNNGLYSKAAYKMITTLNADLGNVVRSGSAEWNAAKESLKIEWVKEKFVKGSSQGYSNYGFTYSGPTNLTAYILCASDEDIDNPSQYPDAESKIIEIEKRAGRRYDSQPAMYDENGDFLAEPKWLDSEGKEHSGGMAIVSDYYVHGYPKIGYVAYFANGLHDQICSMKENGTCTNYQKALEAIQKRLDIEWYKSKFSSYFVMTTEAAVNKAAQELLDFYYPYYKDKKPIMYENSGEAIEVFNPYALGLNDKGAVMDDVYVVLKDANGNYYEPMKFEVPNYFK